MNCVVRRHFLSFVVLSVLRMCLCPSFQKCLFPIEGVECAGQVRLRFKSPEDPDSLTGLAPERFYHDNPYLCDAGGACAAVDFSLLLDCATRVL